MPIISLTDNDDVVTYEGSTTIAPLMEAVPFSPSIPFVYDGYDETGTVYTYVATLPKWCLH